VTPLEKLCRMLRNTVRRWPSARLYNLRDGFGVSLDERTYVKLSYSGNWTPEDMRDLHALFAVWLVADPSALLSGGSLLAGVLQTAKLAVEQSSTPQA
jgi:hypothetical protein